METEGVFKKIAEGIKSPDPEVRKKWVLYLTRIDDPKVIGILEPVASADPSAEIREIAARIINYFSKKYNQASAFVSADQKQKVKKEIEKAEFDPKKLLELILGEDVRVKVSAIQSFYGVKNAQILKIFKKFLPGETNEMVIATYIKGIGSIGGRDEISFLRKYLSHSDDRIKSNTIEALCDLGAGIEILSDILPLIANDNERVRITVSQYLSRIDNGEALAELKKIIKKERDGVKNLALRVTFLYPVEDTIAIYREIFPALGNSSQQMILKHLKDAMHPSAEEFLKEFDTVKFDIAVDLSSEPDLGFSFEKDIFAFEDRLKNDEIFFYGSGLNRLDLGDHEKAIAEFSKAVRINPDYINAWKEMGIAYTRLEKFEKALECFDRVLEKHDDEDSYYNKAITLQKLGRSREANICFDRALELNSRYSEIENPPAQSVVNSAIDKLINEMAAAETVKPARSEEPPAKPGPVHKAETPPPEIKKGVTPEKNIVKTPTEKEKTVNPSLEEIVTPDPEKTVKMKKCLKCKKLNSITVEKCTTCGHVFACVKK